MSANPRIVIPRKLQKFEMKYENDQQRALRERSVLQDFKNEIEMEKTEDGRMHIEIQKNRCRN